MFSGRNSPKVVPRNFILLAMYTVYEKLIRRRNFVIVIGILFSSCLLLIWMIGFPSSRSRHSAQDNFDYPSFDTIGMQPTDESRNDENDTENPENEAELRYVEKEKLHGAGEITEGDCSGLKAPEFSLVNHFQRVDIQSRENMVYSAYYDLRDNNKVVRVVGIMKSNELSDLYCQLWYFGHGHVTIHVVPATVDRLYTDSNNLHGFLSVIVNCENSRSKINPYLVSIVRSRKCRRSKNYLRVKTLMTRRPNRPSFAVCLSPLRGEYDNVDRLLEYAALSRVFGTEKIYLYNSSTTPRMRNILHALAIENMINIIPWRYPNFDVKRFVSDKHNFYDELAMRHDCLFKGMGHFRFLMFANINEILIPRRDNLWLDIFLRNKLDKQQPSSITFRKVYFNEAASDDPEIVRDEEAVSVRSSFLLKTQRLSSVAEVRKDSNYMIDPCQVQTLGLQKVLEYSLLGGNESVIAAKDGLVHHYATLNIINKSTVTDQRVFHFRDHLVDRLSMLRKKYHRFLKN